MAFFNKKTEGWDVGKAEMKRMEEKEERRHKIYDMPDFFRKQVLEFEKKLVDMTYEKYLASLGIVAVEEIGFAILNSEAYRDFQMLWDGLQELRVRRQFAQEKELESLAGF